MSNVFFSAILAISSGPGVFLAEILSVAQRTCSMVILELLGTGSG